MTLGVGGAPDLEQAFRELAQHALLADVIEPEAAAVDQQRTFEPRDRLFVLPARCQRVTQTPQRIEHPRARRPGVLLDGLQRLRERFLGRDVVLGAVLGVTEQRQCLGQRQRLLRG